MMKRGPEREREREAHCVAQVNTVAAVAKVAKVADPMQE